MISSSVSILAKGIVDDKVDFNFKGVELEEAFRILAEAHQMNLITDSSVEGTVTAKLSDISFEKAVKLLARTNGLDYLIIENTMIIATAERLDENFRVHDVDDVKEEFEDELEEITKLFRIENAEPEDVQQSLEILIDGLTISTDSRTRSLLVRGYEEDIVSVEAVISDLDRELEQVYLEAEIISLNLSRAENLGVQWEISDNNFSLNLFGFGSGSRGIDLAEGGNMITANFLQDEGISTTLAKPKLSVLDGENAFINIGREVPIVVGTAEGNDIIERIDVGNILDIRPRIIGEDKILVEIEQELSSIDKEDFSGRGASFETTRTSTTVRVNNGETFVISGLIQSDKDEGESRIPFLGNIPILGSLFRSRNDSLGKQEIIVFITPEILGANARQEIESPLVKEFILEQRAKGKKINSNQAVDDILVE